MTSSLALIVDFLTCKVISLTSISYTQSDIDINLIDPVRHCPCNIPETQVPVPYAQFQVQRLPRLSSAACTPLFAMISTILNNKVE